LPVRAIDRQDGTVSKLGTGSKSCHDLGWHVFRFPHPNPLPEGEGATCSRCAIPSPFGRGTQGEGIRATMSTVLRVPRQPQMPALLLHSSDHCRPPLRNHSISFGKRGFFTNRATCAKLFFVRRFPSSGLGIS